MACSDYDHSSGLWSQSEQLQEVRTEEARKSFASLDIGEPDHDEPLPILPRKLKGTRHYLHDSDVARMVLLALLDHLLFKSGQVPLQVLPLAGILLLEVQVRSCNLHLMGQGGLSAKEGEGWCTGQGRAGQGRVGQGRAGQGRAWNLELTISARCTYFSKRPWIFSFSSWGS